VAGVSGEVSLSSEHDAMMQQPRHELAQKIRQYETGEKGKLNGIFAGSLRHWLDHCANLGKLPAVSGYWYIVMFLTVETIMYSVVARVCTCLKS